MLLSIQVADNIKYINHEVGGGMTVVRESRKEVIRPDFDKSIFIDFQGAKITSDAGFLPPQEVDERFGFLEQIASGIE